ncbi:PatA/PatG family cyanobactin maturation protease [Microcoleus sp. C2C3]|uniref:PatA/PatG family cyanobactin maturation protease n=1 Tax=unclassified Microcoleus TaxID=2642155 RepID=UPI002FD1DAEB
MPDLITIPGLVELWTHTKGSRRITVAVLDGSADMERACFQGSNLTQIRPYWQEEPEPIAPADLAQFWKIEALQKEKADLKKGEEETDAEEEAIKAEIEALKETIPKPIFKRLGCDFHATHIASTIFGQHGSPAPGMAPGCTGINIPIDISGEGSEFISPLNLARAFNLAMEQGANIIHCAACHPTQSGLAHEMIARAVKQCQDNGILVVAPGGNDKGECWCVPAVLPNVLTVGALRDDGLPFKFSNWGGKYQEQGIMTFGENILGAQPGTDEPARHKGTSCAAPIITGLSALLMSLQLQRGQKPDAEAIRAAILESAIPCDPEEVEEPERCLHGKLNIPGTVRLLTGEPLRAVVASGTNRTDFVEPLAQVFSLSPSGAAAAELPGPLKGEDSFASKQEGVLAQSQPLVAATTLETRPSEIAAMSIAPVTPSQAASTITASIPSNIVYALGTVGYDFGSEARRDTFKQLMPAYEIDGTAVPANPYDARQMVDYLEQNPSEGKALIWTLNLELTPIYAIEPKGPFGAEVYEVLQLMLAGQVLAEDSEDFIERVSIPGRLSDRTVELFSGQIVPVISVQNTRGMYGWRVNSLIAAALETVRDSDSNTSSEAIGRSLTSFLHRIYFDLRNLGQTAHDRALNFAATNAFQAASTFAEAVARGMELDKIEVEKSPFCRLDSDCWDVKLKFFDPENSSRAKKVFRFTIDVRDPMPVTLGEVRSWSVPK